MVWHLIFAGTSAFVGDSSPKNSQKRFIQRWRQEIFSPSDFTPKQICECRCTDKSSNCCYYNHRVKEFSRHQSFIICFSQLKTTKGKNSKQDHGTILDLQLCVAHGPHQFHTSFQGWVETEQRRCGKSGKHAQPLGPGQLLLALFIKCVVWQPQKQ
jgi:hypothetical protein